jgi:hypothetical protein
MATIGNSYLSLIDMFRNAGENNAAIAEVAEVLNRLSPVVRNAFTVEANKGTQHQHSIRTGLPAVTWGRLYQGIPQSKSTRANVVDTTGFVEGLSHGGHPPAADHAEPGCDARWRGRSVPRKPSPGSREPVLLRRRCDGPGEDQGPRLALQRDGRRRCRQPDRQGWRYGLGQHFGVVRDVERERDPLDPPAGDPMPASIARTRASSVSTTPTTTPITSRKSCSAGTLALLSATGATTPASRTSTFPTLIAGTVDIYKFMRSAFYKLQGVYATAMRNGDGRSTATPRSKAVRSST